MHETSNKLGNLVLNKLNDSINTNKSMFITNDELINNRDKLLNRLNKIKRKEKLNKILK